MDTSGFVFDGKNYVAKWQYSGLSFSIEDIQQACIDNKRNFIAALPKANPKKSLNIFEKSKFLLFVLLPPTGFLFEYLLEDAVHGVRVVCSGENESGDMLDWYFKIDPYLKQLVKQGRAY